MIEKETGGPVFPDLPESAFPSTFQSMSPEPQQVHRWGMTLRDYFAAKAMQAIFTGAVIEAITMDQDIDCDKAAKTAYTMADAMLEARK